jgi:hypothetical protein
MITIALPVCFPQEKARQRPRFSSWTKEGKSVVFPSLPLSAENQRIDFPCFLPSD